MSSHIMVAVDRDDGVSSDGVSSVNKGDDDGSSSLSPQWMEKMEVVVFAPRIMEVVLVPP